MLPAASVAVALTVCEPSASGAVGVKLQVPPAFAVTVPTGAPSTMTRDGAARLGRARVRRRVVSGRRAVGRRQHHRSGRRRAVHREGVGVGARAGVARRIRRRGAHRVRTVRQRRGRREAPGARSASAVVVPTGAPSTITVTVLPGSAVPLYVGVLSLVVEPLAGVSTTGAAGGVRVHREGVGVGVGAGVARRVRRRGAHRVRTVRQRRRRREAPAAPSAFAVVVPTDTPSTMTVTVLLGSAVPL